MIKEPTAPGSTHVRFTARPSARDLTVNAAALMRGSGLSLLFGTVLTVTSIANILQGDQVVSVISLLLGVTFLTGAMIVPLVWWSIRRRRDLVLAPIDVDADDEGIRISAAYGTSQQSWSVYRHVRETSRAFVLDTGSGAAALLTKRGVAAADIDGFRDLVRRVGLLKPKPGLRRALRPLLWVALGLALSGALYLGPRFVGGIGATAMMDATVSVDGGRVAIHGTTDLPDGAIVRIQALQLDEWDRASSDGVQPDIDTWSWADYDDAVVAGGLFTHTFEIGGWPSGRGLAVVYFWVDGSQPGAVTDRFGASGERLKGPDVTGDGYGPTLEIQRVFQIP